MIQGEKSPVTVQEIDATVKSFRQAIDLREKAFSLLVGVTERIRPSDCFLPGMLDKLKAFADVMEEYKRQGARLAVFAGRCAIKADPAKSN